VPQLRAGALFYFILFSTRFFPKPSWRETPFFSFDKIVKNKKGIPCKGIPFFHCDKKMIYSMT
jgi:hypothetical protein